MPACGGSVIPKCPTGYIAFARGCGHHQATSIRCKSILCVDCERERAAKIRARWTPTLETLPRLKLMTLTIKNGGSLSQQLQTLDTAFRRFLDYRIGRTNRNKIKNAVAKTVASYVADGRISQERADEWQRSTDVWCKYLARHEKPNGKQFKVRKLLRGLSSLEVTYNANAADWHAHRHLIVSMQYMPQIVLSHLWHWASKGAGKVVDIRSVKNGSAAKGVMEAVKYTTKMWEIPEDRHDELLKAMHRKKRIWAIGSIHPQPEEKQPCPGCDSPTCTCKIVATVRDAQAIIPNAMYEIEIHDGAGYLPVIITFARDTKGRQVWDLITAKSEETSRNRLNHQEKGQLLDKAMANHDPPS